MVFYERKRTNKNPIIHYINQLTQSEAILAAGRQMKTYRPYPQARRWQGLAHARQQENE
jgi:hypothetical protein